MRLIPDDVWAVLTIWQEARGEEQAGRVAVAEVIRNRTAQRYASDGTVPGTVLAPYQFSGWNTKDPNRLAVARVEGDDPIVHACWDAWTTAQAGSQTVAGAVLYYAPRVVTPPPWRAQATLVATVGRHEFYRPTA